MTVPSLESQLIGRVYSAFTARNVADQLREVNPDYLFETCEKDGFARIAVYRAIAPSHPIGYY